MSKSNFQIETKKLCKIESELLELISCSGNESLQAKFLEWQEQRDICNEVLITEWNGILPQYANAQDRL